MQLSVIIPALNEADNLRLLIPYLRSHGGTALSEIIVADGGSTDDTVEIAQAAGAVVLQSPVRSRACQMNLGARHARAEILYFVHADATPPVTFVKDIKKHCVEEGIPIGCYRFQFRSNRLLLRLNSYMTRFDRMMCRGGDQTLYITRALFEELGGYKKDHVVMEDYDLLIRARKAHRFVIMDGDVLVSARKYDCNSYLRVNLANWVVFTLYGWGVHPRKLDPLYKKLIKHPKAT